MLVQIILIVKETRITKYLLVVILVRFVGKNNGWHYWYQRNTYLVKKFVFVVNLTLYCIMQIILIHSFEDNVVSVKTVLEAEKLMKS